MMKYVFREDEPLRIKAAIRADPQTIGDALDKIRMASGGELEPKAVVDTARDARHPLHPHFEWNDSVAADSYRLDQARGIIRIVRVVDDDVSGGTSRAFLSVIGRNGVSYRTAEDVKKSRDLQAAVLAQAERDLEAFERRYRELVDICQIVRGARSAVQKRRGGVENRVGA